MNSDPFASEPAVIELSEPERFDKVLVELRDQLNAWDGTEDMTTLVYLKSTKLAHLCAARMTDKRELLQRLWRMQQMQEELK